MLVCELIVLLQVVVTGQNVIHLAQGRLRGIAKDGYVSYTGIPYASITGTLGRFKVGLQ